MATMAELADSYRETLILLRAYQGELKLEYRYADRRQAIQIQHELTLLRSMITDARKNKQICQAYCKPYNGSCHVKPR